MAIAILVVLNLVVLTKHTETAEALQSAQIQTVQEKKAKESVSKRFTELKEEKVNIESSLREERLKTEQTQQENESLKVSLQAKKEREAEAARLAAVKPVAAPQAIARAPTVAVSGNCDSWLAQAGITDMASARILIQRESGCNPFADNPTSDAYGIPQALPGHKMASHGADWATNPVTQLRWMQSYVMERYGSWANALNHSYANNWY